MPKSGSCHRWPRSSRLRLRRRWPAARGRQRITATAERAQRNCSASPIDGASNSGASVAAAGARVVVTWAATSGTRRMCTPRSSQDGGVTFGTPVRVNDVDGDARLRVSRRHAPPSADDVVVAWLSKLDGTSHLRMARSMDDGRTFLPATTPHAADLSGARGWASLTLDRARPRSCGVARRSQRARRRRRTRGGGTCRRRARARDAAGHLSRDRRGRTARATKRAWPPTSASAARRRSPRAGDGTTYVAWRHVYPTNLRDIAVAHSTDGGRTFCEPVRVSEDHWQIDGCPEDGPSIAVTADGVLHVAWPT